MPFGWLRKKVVLTRKKTVSASQKKAGAKPVGKIPARRRSPVKKKPSPEFTQVGKVTHYFSRVKAGVVKITKGAIALGDELYFKGHTTDFRQKVASIQIFGRPVKKASSGKEIGVGVRARVRKGDGVYKAKA